ncbi:hypothetical protein [Kordiimonas marina]|uniref:hypothetical protein n=1 Tax=Kordiimonas marina TaxID=2872312 RepID=UPI001FF68E1B|nr:hypothetical protein [Kordiimonas marina]MCJ9428134.1 hypothetical protein [Kordiimonas marina]
MGTHIADGARLGAYERQEAGKRSAFGRVMVALVLLLSAVWYVGGRPASPAQIVAAKVVALKAMPDGWRVVTVRLQDGKTREIRTLAPFFFKPGYKAEVGIYKRPLLADQYDIVGESKS